MTSSVLIITILLRAVKTHMIFRRAVRREFANTAAGVFVALFSILVSTQLIRLLAQAAGGKLPSDAVIALLGFGALNYLPVLLSLTVFVSVLLTLSRAYRDSEMIIWFSSGLPLTAWVRPVLRFAAPIVLLVAVLSTVVSPWAQSQSETYRRRLETRNDVSSVAPGAFRESAGGERVFFVESLNPDSTEVRNVFVSSVQSGRLGVMVAAFGHTRVEPNGDRFLVLERGRRYEGAPGTTEYRVMEFERYALRIETRDPRAGEFATRALPFSELVAKPTASHLAEILWRVGQPLAALTLALLAIPLSFVNPRAGRANNLIFAILVFMLYNNLLSLCQAWVAQGRLGFGVGVWAVHCAMFLLMVLLFYRRISLYAWFRLRK